MERLTDKKEADAQRREYEIRLKQGYPRNIPEERFLRLAAYEDTGLEPEEFKRAFTEGAIMQLASQSLGITPDRLRELAEADREGKIPKYTIGDTIYDRFGDAWEVTSVERHLLAGEPKWIYRCGHAGTNDYCALWEFEVLTRAEAEAALRREQE